MSILPLVQPIRDAEGERWAVLHAGGLREGAHRQLVFQGEHTKYILDHDWVADPLTPARMEALLAQLQRR